MKSVKIVANFAAAGFRFEKGSLYIGNGGIVVLCTSSTDGKEFAGVRLGCDGEPENAVYYTTNWNGDVFTKFSGSITLED